MWKSGKKSKKIKPDIKIFLNKVFFGYSLYRYKYICSTIQYPCQMKRRNRRTYNGRHGDYFSLDQQNMNCGHNSIITSFVLKRFRATSWYKYDCCKLKFGRQKCTNHSTGFTIDGKGNYPLFGSSTCHMPPSGFQCHSSNCNGMLNVSIFIIHLSAAKRWYEVKKEQDE